jgi:hypothetical protein
MNVTFDRNLFTQIGLDSGSLTMLGTIVHSFSQPGEYRGVVHEGAQVKAVFTISSDKSSANAQATIDLASLVSGPEASHPDDCSCCKGSSSKDGSPRRFVVNPRGYVLFHVSGGSGGYYVHVRRTDAEEQDKGYDSRSLAEGDVFTAIVLRPGAYSIVNSITKAKAELVVNYPKRGEKRYRPPEPVRVICQQKSFEPARVQIDPGQGVIFESRAYSRIQITLEKPDDGPKLKEPARPAGLIANRAR